MNEMLLPFCERESATEWLNLHLASHGLDRTAMYCLHITNSLIQDGKTLFERIPPAALPGCREGGRRNVEASLLLRGGAAASGAHRVGEREKLREQRLIFEYAQKDHCWLGNAPAWLGMRFPKIAEGGEAEVFFTGSFVYKFIRNVYFDSYRTALDRVALHNFFSPETNLKVVGYGVNADNEFGIVVKQPFVKGDALTEDDIEGYLDKVGFKKVKDIVATTEYTFDDFYLGDMHDKNAIRTADGTVILIDVDGRLNVPELKCGGTYKIPEVSFSKDAVLGIDESLKKICPVIVSRAKYEARYHGIKNIQEQLAKTGRYDGRLFEFTEYGALKGFTLQVDPCNRTQLLKIYCDGISAMLDRENAFDEAEKEALSNGLSIKRGHDYYAFNLDLGRVTKCKTMPLRIKPEKTPVEAIDDNKKTVRIR